jgi:hypothetical protein
VLPSFLGRHISVDNYVFSVIKYTYSTIAEISVDTVPDGQTPSFLDEYGGPSE